jgi:hypothetical protein
MSDEANTSSETNEPIDEMPHLDFGMFCMSLASSVLVHLGEIAHPDSGEQTTHKNLPFAKQTIDILGMLREKTRGNLSSEESELIEHLLYDLRMKYVAANK